MGVKGYDPANHRPRTHRVEDGSERFLEEAEPESGLGGRVTIRRLGEKKSKRKDSEEKEGRGSTGTSKNHVYITCASTC